MADPNPNLVIWVKGHTQQGCGLCSSGLFSSILILENTHIKLRNGPGTIPIMTHTFILSTQTLALPSKPVYPAVCLTVSPECLKIPQYIQNWTHDSIPLCHQKMYVFFQPLLCHWIAIPSEKFFLCFHWTASPSNFLGFIRTQSLCTCSWFYKILSSHLNLVDAHPELSSSVSSTGTHALVPLHKSNHSFMGNQRNVGLFLPLIIDTFLHALLWLETGPDFIKHNTLST